MLVNNKIILKPNELSTDKRSSILEYQYDDYHENLLNPINFSAIQMEAKQNSILKFLDSQREKFSKYKLQETKQLCRSKTLEALQYQKAISNGRPKHSHAFKSQITLPDLFMKTAFLNQNKTESNILSPKEKISFKNIKFLTQNTRGSYQTSSNSILQTQQISHGNDSKLGSLFAAPWKHPTLVGKIFDQQNSIYTLDKKSELLQSLYKTKALDSFQKDTIRKKLLETQLIEKGQLGWKYLKHSFSTFQDYPCQVFSLKVEQKKQTPEIPFIPPQTCGNYFQKSQLSIKSNLTNAFA